MKITLLHLSDLHLLTDDKHNQQHILKALFKDISVNRPSRGEIDGIVFSGDFVGKGKFDAEVLAWAENEILPGLLEAAGVEAKRIFMVAGNHDMELPKRDSFLQPVFDDLGSSDRVNVFVEKPDERPFLWPHLSSFNDLRGRLSKATPCFGNQLFQAYCFSKEGFNVGIGCLNSAWKASGRPSDADYGHLLVGERQVELVANSITTCDLKIAVMHHPLAWLATHDGSKVHRALLLRFDALFHGHNHVPDAMQVAHANASLFMSNAGCLYASRDYFNGYSIIEYDTADKQWNVKVREYYEQRQSFDKCTRFSSTGSASFSLDMETTRASQLTLPSEQYLDVIHQKLNALLLTPNISEVAPKSLTALFVEPILGRTSERKMGVVPENDEVSDAYHLVALINAPTLTLFVGQKESGKTTLLAFICANANNPDVSKSTTFGIYINLEALKTHTRAALVESISQFGGAEFRKSEIISLLTEGRVTLCLDNVPLQNQKVVNLIASFVKEFPKNKYVLSVLEDVSSSFDKETLPFFGADMDIAYIHSFRRKHTRQLVEKWFGESADQVRTRVQGILSLLHRLNIPRTPFLITILLWIQERKISLHPVNQAALMDAFVDALLEKLYESKGRGTIDSTIKRHFLSELSLSMYRAKTKTLSKVSLEAFTVEYFQTKALAISALAILPELFEKGVLLDLEDEVCFKFDCFRSFFLALRLDTAKDLYEHAMSAEGFRELSAEIDLFTGLYRDRRDMLEGFFQIAKTFHEAVSLDISPTIFDEIDAGDNPLSPAEQEMILQAILKQRPTIKQQEQFLDEIDDNVPRGPYAQADGAWLKDHSADQLNHPYERFLAASHMCSIVLRNSELIDDAKLKNDIYAALIEWWSEVLIGLVLTVDLHDSEIQDAMPPEIKQLSFESFKHGVKILVPTVVLAMIRESLCSPKLEQIILWHLGKSQHSVQRLIGTFLYTDSDLPDYIGKLEALAKSVNSQYGLQLIFSKVLGILFLKVINNSQARRLQQLVGDVFRKMNSVGVKRIDDVQKQQFLERLRKMELTFKLRQGAKE